MSKTGFSLLEIILSIALSVLLAFAAFDLSCRFISLLHKLEKKGQYNCMCYTALQLLRTDLEGAPGKRTSYRKISAHNLHFDLLDGSTLVWKFDEGKKNLSRTHLYTKNAKLTEDKAIVLEGVEQFSIETTQRDERIDYFRVSLTHNGKPVQTSIRLRNQKI